MEVILMIIIIFCAQFVFQTLNPRRMSSVWCRHTTDPHCKSHITDPHRKHHTTFELFFCSHLNKSICVEIAHIMNKGEKYSQKLCNTFSSINSVRACIEYSKKNWINFDFSVLFSPTILINLQLSKFNRKFLSFRPVQYFPYFFDTSIDFDEFGPIRFHHTNKIKHFR